MTAPIIAFFNNKGGVGKTSLVYHVAWMAANHGLNVLAADLDPQANLTADFLDEEHLERLWSVDGAPADRVRTVFGSLEPLIRGIGDVAEPPALSVADRLWLLPGDLSLSGFEDELSTQWPSCLDGKERAFRIISAFWRLLRLAAKKAEADVVLVDVGPNLGAINRAALVAADNVVFPLAPDLFSAQGLQNLGPRMRQWRQQWQDRVPKNPDPSLKLPSGAMKPTGYVLLGRGVRLGQPVKAYQRWMECIPGIYRHSVLDVDGAVSPIDSDPYCLGQIKHHRSLMPLSYEARKPVFALKPADGAFGGHQAAVTAAASHFAALTDRILHEVGISRDVEG
jgi:cellulose biosynthesis protein BcsQ